MRIAIAWAAMVGLASCSGYGPDIHTTEDNVCDQIAEVACFDMYQCCTEGEIEGLLMVSDPRTEGDCQSDVRRTCKRQIADLDFSIHKGSVRFDSAAMNACLRELVAPSGTCVTVAAAKPWAMACMTRAWIGVVAESGKCDFSHECVTDSVCSGGLCSRLPREADPCSAQGCASGLFCDAAAASGPHCRALLPAGAACTANGQCQSNLFCDTAAPIGMPTCTPLRDNDQICSDSSECRSTLCLTGTCPVTGASCSTDAACDGTCSNAPSMPCAVDSDCGMGTCSIGGAMCTAPTDCTAPGSVCVFASKCNHRRCEGNVCADPHLTIDYCQTAVPDLLLLGAGAVVVGGS